MRTEEEVLNKIKEFEEQKIQIAEMAQLVDLQTTITFETITFLDKQIALLKWVLG